MKGLLTIIVAATMLSNTRCANRNISTACYKGRLEVKGICSNYTIKLIEGNLDTGKIASGWKDEVTGKTYTNVFALGNPCSFPSALNAGDEFYFALDEANQQCAVCMAYYPTPPKKLSIKVLDKACK